MGHINDYTSQLIKKYSLQDYVKCTVVFHIWKHYLKQTYVILVLLEARLEKGIFFASKSQISANRDYRFWRFPQLMDLQ